MNNKLKQAQRAASDAIRLIPAAIDFDASKLDYAAIVVLCEQYAIITPGMAQSNRYAEQLPQAECIGLKTMILNAFIEWCGSYNAPKALARWSEQQ
jgi:hypothetical protein